ncbi:myb-like protein AA isoform X2 [Dendronephthya gigantea]|uniref:myb-like protein AA isoform X2 n=1 Tax=Dendronephthya gigantea TaxID=151771 RepID=UPI001068D668|nr:myb-like protein AA isoform X2 [Dendronephthya gigantea]XP_028398404.1 myb-like protein AA isoform X2 [Dendronephthya gigantea]
MKRKQNIPRRIRPAEEAATAFPDASDEPPAKRNKSDPEKEPSCGDASDVSEWKWNIADFRKEHSENLKEEVSVKKEQISDSKEPSNQLEQPSIHSKNGSSNSSREEYDENLGSSNERMNGSKISVTSTEETKNVPAKDGEYLKEPLLRNPPHISRNQNEVPVESLKEPSSCVKLQSPALEMSLNTNLRERNVSKFGNEVQNDNMPVILNVFSLSKNPTQQFIANTKQINSVLCTPPCSPPLAQLEAFNARSVPSQNPRFRNDFLNQAAFQQPWRDNRYKQVQHNFQNFQGQSNKPVQQVYYNYQENFSKPVQQVSSQEFFDKPVKQVYYTSQEYHQSKPVQQGYSSPVHIQQVYKTVPKTVQSVNSQVYMNNPVQQVYTPQEYFPKQVQPVNLQGYSNYYAQQGNPPYEYWSNPVSNVNRQNYVYNHVPHNSTQIANGVLPLEKQTSNQSLYDVQAPTNTQFPNQRYQNYVNNSEPAPQLNETYSVGKGNTVSESNGIYTRFKLKPLTAEGNKASYHANNVSPLILETPIIPDKMQETTQNQTTGTAGVHFDTTSTVYIQNRLKSFSNNNDCTSGKKYRTETGCSAILDGFGRNRILQDVPATNTKMYDLNVSGNFLANSTTKSENQTIYSNDSRGSTTIYIPVSSNVSGETGKGEYLTARDAKVIQLKQRLEEQEAMLKKLRENH